jgi:phasin family protein
MTPLMNPLSSLGRSSVDVAQKVAKISMDSAERTFAVQLEYAKGAITQATVNARAMASVKDAQSLVSLPTRLAENALENMLGYSRSLYEVASQAQGRYSRLAEERMSEFQNAVTASVDEAAKSAPVGGSDFAVAAIKSQLAATTAAFDTITKAARSMASLADAGVTAARPARRK